MLRSYLPNGSTSPDIAGDGVPLHVGRQRSIVGEGDTAVARLPDALGNGAAHWYPRYCNTHHCEAQDSDRCEGAGSKPVHGMLLSIHFFLPFLSESISCALSVRDSDSAER